jgi:hypothetical protein
MVVRFATEKEVFWRLVVEAKYGCLNGGWCSKEVEGPFGILRKWRGLLVLECGNIFGGGGVFFSSYLSFDVGDGSFISF